MYFYYMLQVNTYYSHQLYFLSCVKEIILEYSTVMDTYKISIKTIVH